MTPAELSTALRACLGAAVAAGDLLVAVPDEVVVERPRQREHGDWATTIALQLAKPAGLPAREVAGLIATRLAAVPGVRAVDVAGPGFLNITLHAAAAGELARTIVEAGSRYGTHERFAGQSINLEFVSANPTGPIHLGGTRWAAVGDSLARVLQAGGAKVAREYYVNDHGAQIDRFAHSLLAAARGQAAPDGGYLGEYVDDIAAQVVARSLAAGEVDPRTLPDAEALVAFRAHGTELMLAEIQQALHDFGVDFDVYHHETDLYASGAVDRAVARLREAGRTYEADGAVWLRTSDLGDTKDRVVIKADGDTAYLAADLAYYLDKRERGFDRVVMMLGADHHGYVGRLMAVCAAFGDTPGVHLEILIGQLVHLVKDGQSVRMSKRAGTIVTLDDLVEAVGVDAARYALVRSSVDSSINIDLDLLVRRTNENPVHYVQYAHARIAGVTRTAVEAGVRRADAFDPGLLDHGTEAVLLAALGEFPRVVAQAGELREPHRVARYLEELAGHVHTWYDACRVTPRADEPVTDAHRTRLWLAEAARTVVANGLALLGVGAPERM